MRQNAYNEAVGSRAQLLLFCYCLKECPYSVPIMVKPNATLSDFTDYCRPVTLLLASLALAHVSC